MTNYREALKTRDVVPNSTWLHENNVEMWIVLPEDDSSLQELMKDFGVTSVFGNVEEKADEPGWMRIARVRVEGRAYAGVDIVFIPLFLGQIDRGILKRIG